jgi:YVTN family beta-propeller protein
MLKRGAPVLLVLALMAGWVIGTSAVWAAGAPKAYVGLFKDDAVAVIDTGQNKVVGTISVPKGPHGLVVTPDGRKVYVSSDGASVVSVIDTANDRVVASIDVGATPHGLAVSGDGSRVLVMGWGSNRVLVIDTATDRVIGEVPVAQPHNGTLSRDGRTGWVASQQQGATALARLDLTAWKETARVPLDKTPRGLELSPDGRRVFFTLAGVNAVQVLDTATGQIVAQIPVGASPHYAPFTPDGRQALAVVQGPGELAILDTASNTVVGTVAVGKAPHWTMANAAGRTAYVTNEGSNDVSVVDLASRTVTATIAVGNAPRKIAVQAAAGAATTSAAPPRAAAAPAGKGKSVTLGGVTYADHGSKDVRNLSKLELEADDYYFSPTFLRGNSGQKLTLIVESEAATLHNLSIPALGIDKDIPPKGKVQIAVTFPASGVLAFFCKFHGPLGMNGQLLTGDAPPSGGASRAPLAPSR